MAQILIRTKDNIHPDPIKDSHGSYKPYSGMATLEENTAWMMKECAKQGVHQDLAIKAINDTFLEMADGLTFPLDGGDTGFDNVPHALFNLYMLKKAIGYHNKSMKAYMEATQGVLQARIKTYVRRNKRREYVEHLKRNSPVLKLFMRK